MVVAGLSLLLYTFRTLKHFAFAPPLPWLEEPLRGGAFFPSNLPYALHIPSLSYN